MATVYALQARVSSKPITAVETRGNGTVELIEFFEDIVEGVGRRGQDGVGMCILSGDVHIQFDGKYRMRKNHQGKEIIAFNQENDLMYPPDPTYVRLIHGCNFPGTLIAIKLRLPEGAVVSAEGLSL